MHVLPNPTAPSLRVSRPFEGPGEHAPRALVPRDVRLELLVPACPSDRRVGADRRDGHLCRSADRAARARFSPCPGASRRRGRHQHRPDPAHVRQQQANQQVCTTASVAPAANALVTVAVMGHNTPTPRRARPSRAAAWRRWTQVATVAFDDVATPHKRLSIFRAMSPSPGSGPLRITFATSQANCQWIVSQWQGVETSGTNGSGAIVQSGSARGDNVTGLVVTLGAFADAGDVAYGVFGVRRSATGVTPARGSPRSPSGRPARRRPPTSRPNGRSTTTPSTPRGPRRTPAALGLEIRAAAPRREPGGVGRGLARIRRAWRWAAPCSSRRPPRTPAASR